MTTRWFRRIVWTSLLTALTWATVPPSYVVEATVLLRYPAAAAVGDGYGAGSGNSYVEEGNLRVLGSVVTSSLQQATMRQELRQRGAAVDYEVGHDWSSPAPLIGYRVTGRTPRAAALAASLLLKRTEQVLADRQTSVGAPPSTWIALEVVQPPSTVKRTITTRRLAATAALLVLSLTAARVVRMSRRREV